LVWAPASFSCCNTCCHVLIIIPKARIKTFGRIRRAGDGYAWMAHS
jgi:hypothetical protein